MDSKIIESSTFMDHNNTTNFNEWRLTNFSADDSCPQIERLKLEENYWNLIEITDKFNRKSVSFQLSKNDTLHSWLKYKEGFSAELVRRLLHEFKTPKGSVVLDPFMGSGTTALVANMCGCYSLGFDILPMSAIAIAAKSNVFQYDINELQLFISEIQKVQVPANYHCKTPYVSITKDGYPESTAIEIAFFTEYIASSDYSTQVKNLSKLCMLNCLEKVSYSAKDGQYLRWDYRCPKVVKVAEERRLAGKKPFVVKLDKGDLPTFKEAFLQEINHILNDIKEIKDTCESLKNVTTSFKEGSALFELPKVQEESISAVISSPPYCNRYDYTRTYAMELAFLGIDDVAIKKLRQDLLSCTVENKTKIERLKDYYADIERIEDYNNILSVAVNNPVLQEIIFALQYRSANGEINNKGVIRMVEGYFTELTFIFAELYRVCQHGAYVAFVNDNVRYAGEVIPVDFLTTMLAEQIGFTPVKIYTLKQKKGNSSQQMKKYGRVSLRKSITIWTKK